MQTACSFRVGAPQTITRALLPSNPHLKFFDVRHGYCVCDVTPDRWRADFRAVASVENPDAPITTAGSFVVENGKPGVVKA